MDWLDTLEPHWAWFTIGLLLAVAEMLIPGVFLIWLAGAALITGALAFLLPIGLPLQIAIFGVLALVAVFAGRKYLRQHPVAEADPKMNRRGVRLAGETAVVVAAIEGGSGRVKHGDSEWLARGADTAVGTRVRITGSDGAVLLVESVD
ncbi:NfeD family protein [Parerythrobacter lacustris]|uniref:NfeD family protein n=1 Tax=Parerythrobacter lacustris TaxID=2969984 RepID=A0ABT1XR37_9SPHN|nr:NfeD family protein [Parerythrobacter lacustris]MCR2834129.1 NfeD family protein [Parerythrobacter lacustris]